MSRLDKIKEILKKDDLDGVLISSVDNISYLTGYTNFSKEEREAYLVITSNHQFIITDGRYSEAISKEVLDFELIERSSTLPSKKIFKNLVKKFNLKKIGLEEHDLSHQEFMEISKIFTNNKHFKSHHLRSIKDSQEIELIKKACNIGDLAFRDIVKKVKPGISEKELALELELFIRKSGAEISFETIVAFGANSSVPHHHTGETKLEDNQFILLDFGVKVNGYCSDMTRTIFYGKPSDKQKKMHKVVLEAQQKAAALVKGNILASEVDKVARQYILDQGYPYIPHSLGHGIGYSVHEAPSLYPKSKDILEEGQVFSIEPGIYISHFGGVRIEDLYTIKNKKIIQLTKSPKDLVQFF